MAEQTSALNITLYDISGNNLNPKYVEQLIAAVEDSQRRAILSNSSRKG